MVGSDTPSTETRRFSLLERSFQLVSEVVHRALRTNPSGRYPSAAEMRDELRAYLASLRRPFGAAEAAAELSDILTSASALKRVDVHPVEFGVLPWPKVSSIG